MWNIQCWWRRNVLVLSLIMATLPILTSGSDSIVTSDGMAIVVQGDAPPPTFASRQIILGKAYNGTGQVQSDPVVVPPYTSLRGPSWGLNGSADAFRYSHPWSVAGTFKNLYVEIMWEEELPTGGGWPDITFTLYINDAPTALTVTVPAHSSSVPPPGYVSSASNMTASVSISPGDRVALTRGAGQIPPSFNQFTALSAWSMTFESTTPGESGYGVSAWSSGKLAATNLLPSGPLMNSSFSLTTDAVNEPAGHSIVPLVCSCFRLDVQLSDAPGAGSTRTYAVMVNSVIQDGSGGTVDSRVAISGTATTGFAEFDVPLAVLQRFSVVQLISSAPAPATSYVTYSVGLRAVTVGESALCFYTGGANPDQTGLTDYAGADDGGWAQATARAPTPWSTSKLLRWPMAELSMSLPGAIDPFTLSHLCLNFTRAPGSGKSYAFTTRQALADTTSTLTMSDSDVLKEGTGTTGTFLSPTDRLDLQTVASGTPAATQTQWTWLVTAAGTVPNVVTTFPIRRVRRFAL